MQHLRREQIPVAVNYPVPLHQQRAFGGSQMSLLESERAAASVISLPLHPCLSAAAVAAVCDAMERFDHAGC
jgi:UDP-2-acetamido-2-deoxy-ribo-hexuluronate aminotransferase